MRGKTQKYTFEEFVTKARKIHGNKYRYDENTFVNMRTKMRIYCTEKDENGIEHGWFEQMPYHHLNGHGCRKCVAESNRKRFSFTTEKCVEKLKELWGNRFIYDYVNYKNYDTKVDVVCKKHGKFPITPHDHLNGHGCPHCYNEIRHTIKVISQEEFINKSKEIHGDKYDYSKVVYINMTTPVKIICRKCGYEFEQMPYSHLQGHGCKYCNKSRLENEMEIFLNKNNIKFIPQCDKDVFEWLGKLSLDFYLPDYNVAIECQGEQHFGIVEKWGGQEKFEMVVERDERKKRLCEENNIKLLYYTPIFHKVENLFTDKDTLLEQILNG